MRIQFCLLSITFLFLASSHANASADPSDIWNRLNKALQQANAVQTLEDYEKTKQNINALFLSLQDLPDSAQNACSALLGFSANELVPFEEQIASPANAFLNSCRNELQNRIQTKYEHDREELRALYTEVNPNPDEAIDCRGKIGDTTPLPVAFQGGSAYGSYNTLPSNSPHIKKLPGLKPMELVFTIDDGPNPGHTEKVLATLASYCTKITFFIIGQRTQITGGLATLKRMLDSGNNIGNHTYSHPIFTESGMTKAKRLDEITKNHDLLMTELAGFAQQDRTNASIYQLTPFFRFPGGTETLDALQYLRAHDTASFTWQAGANDWLPNMTAAKELAEALEEIDATKGGIFLIHDAHQATVDMLPYLLPELTKRGYKIRQMVPM